MKDSPQYTETVQSISEISKTPSRTWWSRPVIHSPSSIAIRLFLTCWLVYVLHFATNTVREIYPALSLGDRLSFDVSEYLGLHPDIFELPGRGAYINNNPGASVLGAIPYALARPVIDRISQFIQSQRQASNQPTPEYQTEYPMAREFFRKAYERGLDVKFGLAAGVMQALLMAPLTALSVVGMFYAWMGLTNKTSTALLLALLYAFATPVFYRVAQLNHNLLQAIFAWFAFLLLWRPWNRAFDGISRNQTIAFFFFSGLLAGWTLVLDYSGLIIILAIGGYAFFRNRQFSQGTRTYSNLLGFATGMLICGGLLILYQWLAFGNPFLPAQHYMPATTYSGMGYQGMDWPHLDLIWENTLGIRYGLFLSSPILILSLYLPGWLPEKKRLIGSLETWFVVFLTLAFLLFTAANQFSRMQFNSGVRHMVPVTPFLFLLAGTVLIRLRPWLAGLIGIFTTIWSWFLVMARDVEQEWGIIGALLSIFRSGIRLPWLERLESMGYISIGLNLPVLLIAVSVIALVWIGTLPTKRNNNQFHR